MTLDFNYISLKKHEIKAQVKENLTQTDSTIFLSELK